MERAAWILQHYEAVAQLAGKMLEAARHGQWDELVELEQQRATALSELMADAAQGAIPDEVADQVARRIGAILETDAESASLAQAWRDELKSLLGSMGVERKISQAYGP
ncbi:MAG: flagellar protein FliT [Sulfurimicrobium sp.]|nr:flagellar protein FliT [Sulfurimicrobium sp.]